MTAKYLRRVHKVLETKLNGTIKGIKTWAVFLLRNSAAFIDFCSIHRERLVTTARSVDIGLIEPIRETAIEAKKQ